MAVITVTRKYASGGRELGRRLAQRLDYDCVDKYLFQKVAENLSVTRDSLESFEKGRQYRISSRFSSLFSKSYIDRIVGYDRTVVEEDAYQKALKDLVLGIARQNNVVIVGRAAHFFLKDLQNCYHCCLLASIDWRRNYATERLGVSKSRVDSILKERDKNHEWFHRAVCGETFEDPHLFGMTFNMDVVPVGKAVAFIEDLVR
jgi:cytidylate kinase